MESGTIIRVVADKGFGFIASGGVDYFFHASDLADGLTFDEQLQERRVAFNAINTPRGVRAKEIRPAE